MSCVASPRACVACISCQNSQASVRAVAPSTRNQKRVARRWMETGNRVTRMSTEIIPSRSEAAMAGMVRISRE